MKALESIQYESLSLLYRNSDPLVGRVVICRYTSAPTAARLDAPAQIILIWKSLFQDASKNRAAVFVG